MLWILAGTAWVSALLSLVSLRYTVPARVRQVVGVATLILLIAAAWRWWTGTWPSDPDAAFFVTLAGTFCDDWITRIGQRRSEAPQPRVVSGTR